MENLINKTFSTFCEQQSWCKIKRFTTADYNVVYKINNNLTIGLIQYKNCKVTESSTWLLDKDKYDSMMQMSQMSMSQPKVTYINHYLDNVTAIWDLSTLNVAKLDLQKHMVQENGKQISKWFLVLPYHLAEIKEETDNTKPMFYLDNK